MSQVTPAAEEGGCGFPPTLWMLGARALEKVSRLECFSGAALLLPLLSPHPSEMHRETQDVRHQQADNTCRCRRKGRSAQMVKAGEIELLSQGSSDVSVNVGTAYLPLGAFVHNSSLYCGVTQRSRQHETGQGAEVRIGSVPPPELQQ